ncbi:DNA-3-methyladenine glycosylase [Tenacibaculum dicentrarchi]|nr:DNA-3-methyladenine glycosylase [Tenacibaculum dicentrarchi]
MKKRCSWVTDDLSYIKYHDTEWGVPVYDDAVLFEFLILESFQAGLSWITILKKRENFRLAFDNFDYTKIANYDENKYQELLQNKGIIRHRLKIKSAILNAKLFIEIQKEFGSFSTYIWSFVQGKPIYNNFKTTAETPVKTVLSTQISTNLKKRGFKFVGDTIMYAYMQAIGMVNDHTTNCFKHPKF